MAYDGFDDNDDPYQFGIHGWQVESDGLTRMPGAALGIVLSVQAADSDDNLLYRLLQADKSSSSKGSQLEASVLLMYDGKEIFQEINNVLILQDKCSQYGPGEKEPSDWTEDVPNGCKDSELKAFYGDGGRTAIQNLSGDWVIVDFLGGILQLPMIVKWFPNPNNNRDAATKAMGKRFVLRRNNTEISISTDGDFHITHRDGQYIQMKNEKITIKHRQGQIIHMDQKGKIFIANKEGNNILIDEDGVSLVAGNASSSLNVLDGGGLTLNSTRGDIDVNSSKSVNVVSPTITFTAGADSSGNVNVSPLCIEALAYDFRTFFSAYYLLIEALAKVPVLTGPIEAYKKIVGLDALALKMGLVAGVPGPTSDTQILINYLTKIVLGE